MRAVRGIGVVTTGQTIVTVALLAHMYGAPAPLMQCLSWYESGHNVAAVNGDYVGALSGGRLVSGLDSEWRRT